MSMLDVAGLCAFYGRAQVLFNVGFNVAHGDVVVLLGRNGAGKSTILKALMGLVPPRGNVQFEGVSLVGQEVHKIARMGVGYVPEDRRIFADLTVLENLEVGRRPPWSGTGWTAERLFGLFPNLGHLRNRPGGRISGGEQQMLAIARTLMGNPRLILLDEPSEGLAPLIVEQMATAIRLMRQEGVTVLLAEQNLHFASRAGDHAVVVERGRVAWAGAMADLLEDGAAREAYLAV